MDGKSVLPVKSDVLFRIFFGDERNREFLIGFLKSVLRIPEDDYEEIEIVDPHLLREFDGDKLGIIDIKLHTKSKKTVHIEIQVLSDNSDNRCYPNYSVIRAGLEKAVMAAA
jgi:predicted transposase/invertase (TIGR01784 family)